MKRKLFFSIVLVIFIMVVIVIPVQARSMSGISQGETGGSDYDYNTDYFKPEGMATSDAAPAIEKVGIVLGTIRNISVVVAVISLMVIGLKYIFGSVEERADYKKSLMPYIIGVVMAATGTTLVTFIFNAVY